MAFEGRIPQGGRLTLALRALSSSESHRTVSHLDLAASAPASQRVLVVLWGIGWLLLDVPYLAFPVSRHKCTPVRHLACLWSNFSKSRQFQFSQDQRPDALETWEDAGHAKFGDSLRTAQAVSAVLYVLNEKE